MDGKALKTAVYLLNRVPTKAVPKTPFEVWTGRKPSLRHLYVWGCPAEARIYNPHEKKLNFKTISGFFCDTTKLGGLVDNPSMCRIPVGITYLDTTKSRPIHRDSFIHIYFIKI